MGKIFVIGSANMDLVARVKELPKPGETVAGSGFFTAFGGKGANQAVAVARMGGEAHFVGSTGKDDYGRAYREHLREEGVDLSLTFEAEGVPTGCAQIILGEQGQNMIVVAGGANLALTPGHMRELRGHVAQDDLIILQFEIPVETAVAAMELAKESGAKVLLNPSPTEAWQSSMTGMVDCLVLNEIELEAIQGVPCREVTQFLRAGRELVAAGCGTVIVTRGQESTLAITKENCYAIPTMKVSPVDTVGAGDTFMGAFAVALDEQKDLPEAVALANCAAGLATTALGAQQAMPKREIVEKYLREKIYTPEIIPYKI